MLVVGLVMGTRMWYSMRDAENDDGAAFERRVDGVVREIGERGKVLVPESVPGALTLTFDERQSYEVGVGTSPLCIFTAARVLSQWVSH